MSWLEFWVLVVYLIPVPVAVWCCILRDRRRRESEKLRMADELLWEFYGDTDPEWLEAVGAKKPSYWLSATQANALKPQFGPQWDSMSERQRWLVAKQRGLLPVQPGEIIPY